MSKLLNTKYSGNSTIPVRKMNFDFTDVPKNYMNGSLAKSHLFDGLNLLFPEGERFFMRAVRDGLNKIDNPDLKQQARGFFGQETQHAIEHEKFFDVLEQNGYTFRRKLNKIDKFILKMRDVLPAGFRLSLTAGAEHLTAILGAATLNDEDIEKSHPAMRDLIQWHAIEEIEHKAVAFDVYQESNGNYLLRILGYIGAIVFIHSVSNSLVEDFLIQDGYSKKEAKRLIKQTHKEMLANHKDLGQALRAYFKPSFHPNNFDESVLLEKAMSRLGIA